MNSHPGNARARSRSLNANTSTLAAIKEVRPTILKRNSVKSKAATVRMKLPQARLTWRKPFRHGDARALATCGKLLEDPPLTGAT